MFIVFGCPLVLFGAHVGDWCCKGQKVPPFAAPSISKISQRPSVKYNAMILLHFPKEEPTCVGPKHCEIIPKYNEIYLYIIYIHIFIY